MKRSFLCSILYFVDRGKAEAAAVILNGGFLMDYNNYDRGYAEPSMSASDYMTRTYRWMAGGLLVTFAMAYITATTPLIYLVNSLYFLLTIGELALVFMLSARVQRMSIDGARAAFFGYAILNGMVLSYYFLLFSVGTLVSLGSAFALALAMDLTQEQYANLLPKSVTTAISMDVAAELGGIAALTGAIVIVTGIVGAVLAETVCKLFHITDPIAKGVGIGTSAHAVGTSKALQMGEVEGAMSGLSIAVAGVLTAVLCPVFVNFIN